MIYLLLYFLIMDFICTLWMLNSLQRKIEKLEWENARRSHVVSCADYSRERFSDDYSWDNGLE